MSPLSISIGSQTDSSERPVCHVIAVFFMGLHVGPELHARRTRTPISHAYQKSTRSLLEEIVANV